MPIKFHVRTVLFASGERFPVLVDRASGLPLFEPTIFCVTAVRAENRAAATIDQVTRAISILYLFADAHGVDILERVRSGRVLDLGEVEALSRYCRLPLDVINRDRTHPRAADAQVTTKVVSLEKVRVAPVTPLPEVDAQSAGIRMRYIRDYLAWLTTGQLMKLPQNDPVYAQLQANAEAVIKSLTARIPSGARRTTVGRREGMSPEAFSHLLEVIEPDSPDNPWTSAHARERNSLAVLWLLSLGLRRGELLGVRISDINFQKNEVFIARRADNPDDPRARQPLVKTRDRLVPLDPEVVQRTHRYITGARRAMTGARRHDFLFVANGSGDPLSLDALNRAFTTLRERCPSLPSDLTPHVLRHTWNDRFSEHTDSAQVSEEQEKKMRSYLMGWSETSGTASNYTRRHVRKKAAEVSLALQNNVMKGKRHDS